MVQTTFNEEKSVTYIVITLCMETTYVCIQCISLLLIALHTQEAKITRAEDVRVVFKELTRKHDTISCCIHLDNEKFPSHLSILLTPMKNRSSQRDFANPLKCLQSLFCVCQVKV